jgi:hypothetical protein
MNPIIYYPQRSFVKSLEDRKEAQDKKAFTDDIKYFLGKETFNLHDFHERVLVSISRLFIIYNRKVLSKNLLLNSCFGVKMQR